MSTAARKIVPKARQRAVRTEQKQEVLLARAAALMARHGFESTAMRDVARETRFSLAGMYYYFKSKEDLLFQIQHRTFEALVELQERAEREGGTPEARLRRLVQGHLAFFTRHPDELKVCTYELESLSGESYRKVEWLRRRYFKLVASVVAELLDRPVPAQREEAAVRHATMFIFGMLNWVFMWFDPAKDAPVEQLANEMTDFVLPGLCARAAVRSGGRP